MLSLEDSKRLQVLAAALNASDRKTANVVSVRDVFEVIANGTDMDQDAIHDYLVISKTQGHVSTDSVLSGDMYVVLTPEGKSVAREFDRLRNDPVARIKQLQDDYLGWLFEQIEIRDNAPTPNGYLATNPAFHGVSYTPAELEKAGERLAESAFITGQAAWQYRAPLRPDLTAKGRHTVEQGRSVHDVVAPRPTQSITTHVHGNANVANASSSVEQHLTIHEGEWTNEVAKVLDAVAQALPSLGSNTEKSSSALIDDARQAVEAGDRSRALRALRALGGFLGDSASGALGGILAAQIGALLTSLGG